MLSKEHMEHINTGLRQRGWQQQDIRKLRTLLILLDRRIGKFDAQEQGGTGTVKQGVEQGKSKTVKKGVAGREDQVMQKIAEGDTQ